MVSIINQWRQKEENFVETVGSKSLAETLEAESAAMVTGSLGSGKSCTAQHALLHLSTAGYDVLPVASLTDMVRYFSKGKKQAFYIDNLYGKYHISCSDIDEWERNRDKISDILTSSTTKCVFTSRLQIYNESKALRLNFKEVRAINLSDSHQLTLNDKKSISRQFMPNNILKCLNDDTIIDSECFPLLCSLYNYGLHQAPYFFEDPDKFLKSKLDDLKRNHDKLKYACIALCVIFNDNVKNDTGLQSADLTTSNRVNIVLEECEVSSSTSRKAIVDQFDSMVGSYFQKFTGGYKSIHDYMFDIYCSHVSTSMPQCVIKHSVSSLFRDRVLLQSVDGDNHNFSIIIPPEMEDKFWKRIVNDLDNCKIWDVYSSQQMKYEAYRSKLLLHVLPKKEIIDNTDNNGISGLFVASFLGYSDIVGSLSKAVANVDQCNKRGQTPLLAASSRGHKPCVDELMLINKGVGINIGDNLGGTPIFMASQEGHFSVVEKLCNSGGNVNQRDKRGYLPLHIASLNGHKECVDVLLRKGALINACDIWGNSPLHMASQKRHKGCVDTLLCKEALVNTCNTWGNIALHMAAQEGNTEIIEMICTREENVNQSNKNGWTPLHMASCNGHKMCVSLLLSKGAEVNKDDIWGNTPLCIASHKGQADVVQILCKEGGKVNQSNTAGYTPLHAASYNGHKTCVDLLLSNLAEVNKDDNWGNTPLCIASHEGKAEVVKLLCSRGGNVDHSNSYGYTSLHMASFQGHSTCVDLLLTNDAEVNKYDIWGNTPLCLASHAGQADIIEKLCSKGGNVNQSNSNGWTPLHIASYGGHSKCVGILRSKEAEVYKDDIWENTPLCIASNLGLVDVVEILCNRGVNVDQSNSN